MTRNATTSSTRLLHGQLEDTASQRPLSFPSCKKSTIAVDPVALITTECVTITSAMRKNARWAQSSVSAILGGGQLHSRASSTLAKTKGRKSSSGNPSTRSAKTSNSVDNAEDPLTSRWGLRGMKGKSVQDNPLISAFAHLRNDLRGCTNIGGFDTPSLLHPFLQVIRSSSTSAPITSLALVAITKFLTYNIITRESSKFAIAMQLLSAAITNCRFESSDSAADETVLLRILRLMEIMLSGPGGEVLGDQSVCEIMECGLSICCQARSSELVRRSGEMSISTMIQLVFERLKHIEGDTYEEIQALNDNIENDTNTKLKMDPSKEPTIEGDNELVAQEGNTLNVTAKVTSSEEDDVTQRQLNDSDGSRLPDALQQYENSEKSHDPHSRSGTEPGEDSVIAPYSLPSIRELFRVLIDLLSSQTRANADALRVMALRIIDVALEVAGSSIAKHPSLASLVTNGLCRYLFQLVRSEHVGLLHESLRVAGTLLATCRGVLKLQQELYLSYLVACLHTKHEIPMEPGIDPALYQDIPNTPKLVKQPPSQATSGRSTPVPVKDRQKLGMEGGSRKPDAREAMVENIGALSRIPSFMAELFVNYDCEIDRSDLCEDLVGLLSRNAFPDSATWSTTNVPPLCLDSLLGHIQFIADRLDEVPRLEGYPSPDRLRIQRARKKTIIQGTTKFNEDPKAGIAFLASQGIILSSTNPESIVKFLRGTTRISKSVLGDYLSKKSHEHLLKAYLDLFNFDGKRIDEALRDLLNSFRLPGESALIERIVSVFSEKYCNSSVPAGVANADAALVLTYAIILLNTDQHNPNLKDQKRMAYNDFARNLRGCNADEDFAPEYLQAIYDSIKHNEIILPDEHNNQKAFDYAWEELLQKTHDSGPLLLLDTNIYDADMFAATWKPVIGTLSYVFMSASEDTVFPRIVSGFDQCAHIAAKYGLSSALDQIVFCLSNMTSLSMDSPPNTTLNTEIKVGERNVMVSELAVKFGRDFRAQLALVVLFNIVRGKEKLIRKGWKDILRIWMNLFVNSLIPSIFPRTDMSWDLPAIPLQPPCQVVDRVQRSSDSGLFSSLTSYLSSYAADDPPEPSEEELESTFCTVDCIKECNLDQIFSELFSLDPDAASNLVQILLEELPDRSSPVVIVVKTDRQTPAPARDDSHRQASKNASYDPSTVFALELATTLAIRDSEVLANTGQAVADALQNIIRNSTNTHSLTLSRAVVYLLRLMRVSQAYPFVRAPVILHTISGFDHSLVETTALPVLKGLSACIIEPGPLRNEICSIPDFWSILQAHVAVSEAAPLVFKLLNSVILDPPPAITADNYEPVVALLNSFATAGKLGAIIEQKRDRNARGQKPAKLAKPRDNEVVDRAYHALLLIHQLTSRVPMLIEQSHLQREEAWITYWSPIFKTLRTQCLNPCREIRHQALSCLQRSLLSPDLASQDHQEWTAIFGEVLFPLLARLMKPEVWQTDPIGMSETRVQAATLLCKIFLHYLVLLSEWDGMLDLWLKILDALDRLMKNGDSESLEEAVPESLKNIVLVMLDGGYLKPPDEGQKPSPIWEQTWSRLERFLPGLYNDISQPKKMGSVERKSEEKPELPGNNGDQEQYSQPTVKADSESQARDLLGRQ